MAKPNRLIHEKSAYLLQHAYNPVDWFPWGKDAIEKAHKEQKPIFLSIGYSACHWCHVMEHESFQDEDIAKLLNSSFVSIKVDREERLDLDHIYMAAVELLTHRGGWPMSVFLTPNLEPFYAGTYFPRDDRLGMPGFKRVLLGVINLWNNRRNDALQTAKQLRDAIAALNATNPAASPAGAIRAPAPATDTDTGAINTGANDTKLSTELLDSAINAIADNFDPKHGGFGGEPKFFHTVDLKLCLAQYFETKNQQPLNIVLFTLERISRGGVYDHLGGGFHRYSTDSKWLVPHFEKMLYDNALLTETFVEAYQVTINPLFARTARAIIDFVFRDLKSNEGFFYGSIDADSDAGSEKKEGAYYVWTKPEILAALDSDLAYNFCEAFGVTSEGNFEGQNILFLPKSLEETAKALDADPVWFEESIHVAKRKLLQRREARPKPFRDEKLVVSWNAMMVHALCQAYQTLHEPTYLETAQGAVTFILRNLGTGMGGVNALNHDFMNGRVGSLAFLDDYAWLIQGLVSLYESDFDITWLTIARNLANRCVDEYWDKESASFFFTSNRQEQLIVRPREHYDGATPSATAVVTTALLRLARLFQDERLMGIVESTINTHAPQMKAMPQVSSQFLIALQLLLHGKEFVLVPGQDAEENERCLRLVRESFVPAKVVAMKRLPEPPMEIGGSPNQELPLVAHKSTIDGHFTLYICEQGLCKAPAVGEEEIQMAVKC